MKSLLAHTLAATLGLCLLASCFAHRGTPRPGELSLREIARRPRGLVGRTVATRGRVLGLGEVPEGTWIELTSSDRYRGSRQVARPAPEPVGAAEGVTFLLPARTAAGLAEELRGRQVEMRLRIGDLVTLPDGRQALRAWPIEIALPLKPATTEDSPLPEELRAATAKLTRAIHSAEAEFFVDPGLDSARLSSPAARLRLLDPGKRRPFWLLPGPAAIEKKGPPGAPRYRFTTTTESANGYRKESSCRFRVEAKRLRSVAYDEVVRDPSGKIVGERHLDFLSGKVMDKVSGKMLRWPKNIYAAPCLAFALMGFPFSNKRVANFFMWSEYDPFTTMYAVLDGTETVAVPAGTFECYRIRMNANIEHMIRSLKLPTEWAYDVARETARRMRNPDTLLWFTREPPHVFIKMAGVMGPPGTSRGVVEITALDPSARAVLASGRRRLVSEVWAAPERFSGQTVHLHFRIAASGESNGGRWLEAEVGARSADRPRFFVPGEVSLPTTGKEVDLRARIRGVMSLDTGGRAVLLGLPPRTGAAQGLR